MNAPIRHAGLTDRGRVRERNEDHWAADPEQGLYIVSDGLGGEYAGALASKIVVETLPGLIRQHLAGLKNLAEPKAGERLAQAIVQLSLEMRRDTKDKPGLDGMGATVVLGIICGSGALLAHMGDSRAYLWRQKTLTRLTKDHSVVQFLLDQGEIKPEDVPLHPARARITRFLGMFDQPLPEIRTLELQPGDRLLLCTDGLTGMLSNQEISGILGAGKEPEQICRRLVDAANQAGGRDNVTVLVIDPAPQRSSASNRPVAPGNPKR